MNAQIVHGGRLDEAVARYGGVRTDWLDLSTGINPSPWPIPEISADAFQRLPDGQALRELLSTARLAYGAGEDVGLVAANGTQALIEMLPHVLSCNRVAALGPTYQEHALCWTKAGRHVDEITSIADLPALSNALVIVNPNNPDGRVIAHSELIRLAETMALRHGWLIVDEAFADCDSSVSIVPLMKSRDMPENVIVLRSFGKFYGLAGLRLGFGFGPQAITVQLEHMFGPWAVSGPSLEIGAKALADLAWTETARQELRDRAERLNVLLTNAGFTVMGGTSLFLLAKHANAKDVYEGLCKQHILTRRFPQYPDWLRLGVCADDSDLQRLQLALEAME